MDSISSGDFHAYHQLDEVKPQVLANQLVAKEITESRGFLSLTRTNEEGEDLPTKTYEIKAQTRVHPYFVKPDGLIDNFQAWTGCFETATERLSQTSQARVVEECGKKAFELALTYFDSHISEYGDAIAVKVSQGLSEGEALNEVFGNFYQNEVQRSLCISRNSDGSYHVTIDPDGSCRKHLIEVLSRNTMSVEDWAAYKNGNARASLQEIGSRFPVELAEARKRFPQQTAKVKTVETEGFLGFNKKRKFEPLPKQTRQEIDELWQKTKIAPQKASAVYREKETLHNNGIEAMLEEVSDDDSSSDTLEPRESSESQGA